MAEFFTFGLRSYKVAKSMLRRETIKVKTKYGEITIKAAT